MSSKRWTDQETAFLLNYADECRLAKEDYMQTVESALLKHTGRSATYRAIQSKIRNLLSRHSPQNSLELFLLAGTAHFHELPPPLLIEMQKHRPEHLGGLQLRGTSDNTSRMEPLVDRDGTFNADDATRDRNERKRGAPKSYLESSVPDSATDIGELGDEDYVDKTLPTARKNVSARNTSGNHKETQKRKASAEEVCDSSETPPPKRLAHDRVSTTILGSAENQALQQLACNSDHLQSGQTHTGLVKVDLGQTSSESIRTPNDAPCVRPAMDDTRAEYCSQPLSEPNTDDAAQVTSNEVRPKRPVLQVNSSLPRGSETPFQAQKNQKEWEEQIKAQSHLLMYMVKRSMTHEHLGNPGVLQALKTLSAGSETISSTAAKKLVQSANSYRAAQDNMRQVFKAAFGRHEPGTDLLFPPVPTAQEINQGWCRARSGLRECFENEYGSLLEGPDLQDIAAGFIACTIDHLLRDPRREKAVEWCPEGYLESPHAAQALTSAIFCRWLFATPDEMCHGVHNELQLAQYNTISLSDGLAEVQRLDKIAFSAFFADPNFQNTALQTCIQRLHKLFDRVTQIYPASSGVQNVLDPNAWAEAVFKLKQRLMISPREYRVHFCPPGAAFDPTWMEAEDQYGDTVEPERAASMRVRITLFPALLELDPKEFQEGQSVEAALIKNKNFLPLWQDEQVFDAKTVVSKAVVFVT